MWRHDLAPSPTRARPEPRLSALLAGMPRARERTIDFLVGAEPALADDIAYVIRMEPGVQTPDQTLAKGRGSCRDSAWLLVQMLRHLGFAARFVSGYLIQLAADVKALDGPPAPPRTSPTCTPGPRCTCRAPAGSGSTRPPVCWPGRGISRSPARPSRRAPPPITGASRTARSSSLRHERGRLLETPRVTKPYTETEWQAIATWATRGSRAPPRDVRLTMGGEPTFVSIDDIDGAEWNTARARPDTSAAARNADPAAGEALRAGRPAALRPGQVVSRRAAAALGALLLWRPDGEPIWQDPDLLADPDRQHGIAGPEEAAAFAAALATRLGVAPGDGPPGL